MKRHAPIARRLREHGPHEHAPEARLGEVVRNISAPSRLSNEAHARILRRLRLAGPRRWERLSLGRRPVLAAGVLSVAIVLLGIGAQAAISRAVRAGLFWAERVVTDRVLGVAPARVGPVPVAATPPVRGANERALVWPGAPSLRNTMTAAPLVSVAPSSTGHPDPSPLAQESRLLSTALDQLRTTHDYAGALATLAEYDVRFPDGALRSEATLARLDALTALGESAAALRLLDTMELTGPRAAEMLVLRGELRSNAGRYREATADFDRSLSRRSSPSLHERGLYGRASSRARLGDTSGAKEDLENYLTTFPEGPHAGEVRRSLNR